jgi:hypothetical protein
VESDRLSRLTATERPAGGMPDTKSLRNLVRPRGGPDRRPKLERG